MGFEVVFLQPVVDEQLGEHDVVDVLRLLADRHLGQDGRRADRVADTDAGSDDLRERTGIDDPSLFIETLDTGKVFAGDPQIAVGVVFQDDDVVFAGEVVHGFSLFERHGAARRVLEVRDRVKEADLVV